MPLENRHIQTYLEIFCSQRARYAQQTQQGRYFLKPELVTLEVVRKHLRGEITAGWYALGSGNLSRWVVLDADKPDGLEQLQESWQKLNQQGIPSQLEMSRRGGHLWVLSEPTPAQQLRQLIFRSQVPLERIEVYPKQDGLGAGIEVGSLLRGPLGIHQLSGRRYPFVDPISLAPVSQTVVGTIECLQGVQRLSSNEVEARLANLPPPPDAERRSVSKSALWNPSQSLNTSPIISQPISPIEAIKQRIGSTYEFISQFVELDQKGRGHCPFHPPDNNPSFAVDRRRDFWVDFHVYNPKIGRHQGGDAIEFYRRIKHLSYKEAVKQLMLK